MIKTNVEDLDVHIDPLSFAVSMRILSGNTVQIGDGSIEGYMPSRKFIPCKILPEIHASDPEEFQDGLQKIASCKWYEGQPLADDSNVITASTEGYEIIMTEEEKYALKVKKDFPPFMPQVIHACFSFLDIRTGVMIDVERQITFSTVPFDAAMLHVQPDDTPVMIQIDPLMENDCGESPWWHNASVQLFSGINKVEDAKVTYHWQIMDEVSKKFRDFTADEKEYLVKGQETRTISFDARFIEKICLRCSASTEVPGTHVVDDALLQVIFNAEVRLPHTMEGRVVQLKYFRLGPRMNEEVAYKTEFFYNKGEIEDAKAGLFKIRWRVQDINGLHPEMEIGEGQTVRFVPRDLGFDRKSHVMVSASVLGWSCMAFKKDSNGNAIVNSKGEYLTIKTYK